MSDEIDQKNDNKPPVLGSWKNFYILVLGFLLVQIVLFYAITTYYA